MAIVCDELIIISIKLMASHHPKPEPCTSQVGISLPSSSSGIPWDRNRITRWHSWSLRIAQEFRYHFSSSHEYLMTFLSLSVEVEVCESQHPLQYTNKTARVAEQFYFVFPFSIRNRFSRSSSHELGIRLHRINKKSISIECVGCCWFFIFSCRGSCVYNNVEQFLFALVFSFIENVFYLETRESHHKCVRMGNSMRLIICMCVVGHA